MKLKKLISMILVLLPGLVFSQTYDLLKFHVQYNTTDFSYLTTTAFSDAASLNAAAKTVSVATIAPNTNGGGDNANAVVGTAYFFDEINGDRIAINEIDGSFASVFPADNMTEAARLFTVTAPNAQGITSDPTNEYLHNYNGSAGTLQIRDLSGNLIETLTGGPIHTTDCMVYYDYIGGDNWYIAREGASNFQLQRLTRGAASTFSLSQTYWHSGADAVYFDHVFDKLIQANGSGGNFLIRENSIDGLTGIALWPVPIATIVVEGILTYPDGTFGFPDPSGYTLHGGIVGGNRWWRTDPRGVYLKYDRFPSMTRFGRFKGGTVTGVFDGQILKVTDPVLTPVFDFVANTNQQNLSAWVAETEVGSTYTLRFRGSDTAPTGASFATMDGLAKYDANDSGDGWGSTTPSAWQGTPTAHRYMQCEITISADTPVDEITIEELVAGLQPSLRLLIAEYDDETMYVQFHNSNRIQLAPNQADPNFNWANTVVSQAPVYDVASSYTNDIDNNANWNTTNIGPIAGDQQGQVTIIGSRVATNVRAIHLSVSQTATANQKIIFRHNSTADSPASEVCIEVTGATGTVVNRVGFVNTSTTIEQVDFISTGSAYDIKLNGVSQTLNVSVGSDNGMWIGDLDSPTRLSTGFAFGSVNIFGRHFRRLILYMSVPADGTQQTLIDDFATQESLR